MTLTEYTAFYREKLQAHQHQEYAIQMKSYMRNQYAFFGIRAPARKALLSEFIKENGYPDNLSAFAKMWWKQPEREFQHSAMEILNRRKKTSGEHFITTVEWLITNKSWWDTVDFIAATLVGYHFKTYPQITEEYVEKWMNSDNMWLQRTCLLFQLKYKEELDWNLLQSLIHQLKHRNEFFIRKAIGWALRQHSKTNPEEVMRFVRNTSLSGLSKTEALKVINRKK